MAQKNPFVVLGLPAELVDSLLPHSVLILAEARFRAFARFRHPDVDRSKGADQRFRAIQGAWDELQREDRFDYWKVLHLRAAKQGSTAREEQDQVAELTTATREFGGVQDALNNLILARSQGQFFYDTEKVLNISAANPPACRILLSKAYVFVTGRRVAWDLLLNPDGSITCFDVVKRKFYMKDGEPSGVPETWMHRHASGPTYVSRYWHRLNETARPFPYRLLGGIKSYARLFSFWWDVPSSMERTASPDKEPAPLGDDLGDGVAWEDLANYVQFIKTSVRAGPALVLTRLVEGEPRIWMVGPVEAVHVL